MRRAKGERMVQWAVRVPAKWVEAVDRRVAAIEADPAVRAAGATVDRATVMRDVVEAGLATLPKG